MSKTSTKRYNKDFLLGFKDKSDLSVKDYERVESFNKEISNQIPINDENNPKNTFGTFEEFQRSDHDLKIEYIERLILNTVNKRDFSAQNALTQFLKDSLNQQKYDSKTLKEAVGRVMFGAEQMAVNFFNLTTYASQLIEALFTDEEKPVNVNNSRDFTLQLLINASCQTKNEEIQKFLQETNLDEKNDEKSFSSSENIETKSLEPLSQEEVKNEPEKTLLQQMLRSYRKKLKFILANPNDDVNFIHDRIKTEFCQNDFDSREFVGTLALSLCKSCLSEENNMLDSDLFMKRIDLLQTYMSSNEVFKMEVLNAIKTLDQALLSPPGNFVIFIILIKFFF